MAAEYPFKVPKAIENDLLKAIAQAGPPWQGLDEWSIEDHDPSFVSYFNCWRGHTAGLLTALELSINQCEPVSFTNDVDQAKWESIAGTLYALKTRFAQFQALLEWARRTWKYDPAISSVKTEPIDPVPEKESNVIPLSPAN